VIAGAWFAARPPFPKQAVAPEPVVADVRPSLVVLPFANLSDNEEQGYLADGITEDLTTELARVPGLFVISPGDLLCRREPRARLLKKRGGLHRPGPPPAIRLTTVLLSPRPRDIMQLPAQVW